MKRETVKELLTLSDETLKRINYDGLVVHREVAQHYANGGDVEMLSVIDGWEKCVNPKFFTDVNYRKALPEIEVFGVKVRANPPETESLKVGEKFYSLNVFDSNMYSLYQWVNDLYDVTALKNKAIWKNESDIKAVVKALRGEK